MYQEVNSLIQKLEEIYRDDVSEQSAISLNTNAQGSLEFEEALLELSIAVEIMTNNGEEKRAKETSQGAPNDFLDYYAKKLELSGNNNEKGTYMQTQQAIISALLRTENDPKKQKQQLNDPGYNNRKAKLNLIIDNLKGWKENTLHSLLSEQSPEDTEKALITPILDQLIVDLEEEITRLGENVIQIKQQLNRMGLSEEILVSNEQSLAEIEAHIAAFQKELAKTDKNSPKYRQLTAALKSEEHKKDRFSNTIDSVIKPDTNPMFRRARRLTGVQKSTEDLNPAALKSVSSSEFMPSIEEKEADTQQEEAPKVQVISNNIIERVRKRLQDVRDEISKIEAQLQKKNLPTENIEEQLQKKNLPTEYAQLYRQLQGRRGTEYTLNSSILAYTHPDQGIKGARTRRLTNSASMSVSANLTKSSSKTSSIEDIVHAAKIPDPPENLTSLQQRQQRYQHLLEDAKKVIHQYLHPETAPQKGSGFRKR